MGAGWHKSPRARRCVAGLVAFAYFVLWIALLVRSRAQPALFWDRLLTPEAFLARLVTPEAFFILAAYAVGLSALTANDVPAFFRAGFHYLHVVRRLGRWLPDSSVADGWLAVTPFALHVGVAMVMTLAAIRVWITAGRPQALTGPTAAALVLSAQALILVPVYALLLLPAIGFARALAASQLNSVPVDPERRDNLLAATPPARWLLLSVAAFGAVSLFQAARMRGAPWPVGLALILERLLPNLGPAAEIMALVLVAFVTIAIHYLLLVELPYTLGQRRWKRAALRRTREEVRTAEQALADLAGDAAGLRPSAAAHQEPAALALGRYTLALQRRREANETPLHTLRGIGDIVRKASGALLLSAVTALLGGKGPDGAQLTQRAHEEHRAGDIRGVNQPQPQALHCRSRP